MKGHGNNSMLCLLKELELAQVTTTVKRCKEYQTARSAAYVGVIRLTEILVTQKTFQGPVIVPCSMGALEGRDEVSGE